MAKIPKQRGAGQRGGAGGQLSNRGSSYSRGGRPSAGGGGTGRKPPGGCLFAPAAGMFTLLLAFGVALIR
jgi:hypothetical protein